MERLLPVDFAKTVVELMKNTWNGYCSHKVIPEFCSPDQWDTFEKAKEVSALSSGHVARSLMLIAATGSIVVRR
jgi:hypothetical protein